MSGQRVLLLSALLLVSSVSATVKPELDDFEELFVLDPKQEAKFDKIDAELLVKDPSQTQRQQKLAIVPDGDNVPLWQEEGYEPYSDELDSYVTDNGIPDPLNDDKARTNRYENWLRNYKRQPNEKVPPWSYDGADTGPDMWGSLQKSYQLCDPDITGPSSSPIDIDTGRAQPMCYGPSFPLQAAADWSGNVEATLMESFDRSVTVDVMHCTQPCKICEVSCSTGPTVAKTIEHPNLKLDRFVVHTPAEHKIDGTAYDMEIQFLHCSAEESYHVIPCIPKMAIAVLFKDGGVSATNPGFVEKLAGTLNNLDDTPKEAAPGFKFADIQQELQPLLSEYYSYIGSQTYPPCYQGVQWMIATQVLTVSTSVIQAFKARQGENVRPEFVLGRRKLAKYSPEGPKHWTYKGPRGQDKWGNFGVIEYSSCGKPEDCEQLPNQAQRDVCLAEQQKQSPVNIYTNECQVNVAAPGGLCVTQLGQRPLKFELGQSMNAPLKMYVKDCECRPCNNKYNGYTFTVVPPGSPSIEYTSHIDANGHHHRVRYVIEEITFHTGSEHAFDGVRSAMEVQFHMSSGNQRINMAVLFDEGATSPQWVSDLALVADDAKGTPLELNPSMFFNAITLNLQPMVDVYFVYEGSETTPPCHTGVTWFVLKNKLTVSKDDLRAFSKRHVGGNARKLQKLNGRTFGVYGTVQL